MKRIALLVAAGLAGLFVIVHPLASPRPGGAGWSAGPSGAFAGARAAGPDASGPLERRPLRRTADSPGPAVARTRATALVYVAGQVARPGVYAVSPEARARDALALAGGAKPGADLVAVNLAAHVADGDEVVVPKLGEPAPRTSRRRRRGSATASDQIVGAGAGGGSGAGSHGKRHRATHHRGTRRVDDVDGPAPAGLVDLNAADAATLATIPGIGPGLAERIVAFRAANGPFASVDELLDVSGITDRRLDAILPYVVAR